MVKNIISILGVPLLGVMLAFFDSRNRKRGEARDKLNGLILTGFDAMGNLALTSALKTLGEVSEKDVADAITEYRTFRTELKGFTRDQTKNAVRL